MEWFESLYNKTKRIIPKGMIRFMAYATQFDTMQRQLAMRCICYTTGLPKSISFLPYRALNSSLELITCLGGNPDFQPLPIIPYPKQRAP